MDKGKRKIAVLMSGGVDSSVAATLLKNSGYNVVGVFGKFLPSAGKKDAEKIAKKIGIKLYSFDLVAEFKKRIINYFVSELKNGKTPNPCVLCNKEMKFGLLLEKAAEILKIDYIASGHYAAIGENRGRYFIKKAEDKNKDQSYFLWQLKQSQLRKIIFPLSNIKKEEVKKIAQKLNIRINKKESQEICFVGKSVSEFLAENIGFKGGEIIDVNGNKVGEHRGVWFYTIGQRKGIKLSSGPWYIIGKDLRRNLLIVSKNKGDLFRKKFRIEKANWQLLSSPSRKFKAFVVVRYNSKPILAKIEPKSGGKAEVIIEGKGEIITPGQSAVFYDGNNLLGGGIIT